MANLLFERYCRISPAGPNLPSKIWHICMMGLILSLIFHFTHGTLEDISMALYIGINTHVNKISRRPRYTDAPF